MDPRVELYKKAFTGRQSGGDGSIPKFYGLSRHQNGGGFGDVLRGLLRRVIPVANDGFAAFLRAGGESIKDGNTWKQALKSAIKPTIGAVLTATADQIASKQKQQPIAEEQAAAIPPTGPPIAHTDFAFVGTQIGSGGVKRRGRRSAYKKTKSSDTNNGYSKRILSLLNTSYSHQRHNPSIYNY